MKRLILGPPGTGKTEHLLNDALRSGDDPKQIGFVSFTRRSITEARERIMRHFGIDETEIPYWRTLHSLCFRQLSMSKSQMLSQQRASELLATEGYEISTGRQRAHDDSAFSAMHAMRVGYLPIETVAEQYDVNESDIAELARDYDVIKADHGLFDFTDLLENFVANPYPPPLSALYVDEAQDLNPLQWDVVAALTADHVTYAGDDDQTIFAWAGADVNRMLALDVDSTTVLEQSWRLPESVHKLAVGVSAQIRHRHDKVFRPREHAGIVDWIGDLEDVESNLTTGSWYLLARHRYLLRPVAQWLRECGLPYWYHTREHGFRFVRAGSNTTNHGCHHSHSEGRRSRSCGAGNRHNRTMY